MERRKLLERDIAVEIRLTRQVHPRHPAAANLAQDVVPADGFDHA
jgi:hypothetical protein